MRGVLLQADDHPRHRGPTPESIAKLVENLPNTKAVTICRRDDLIMIVDPDAPVLNAEYVSPGELTDGLVARHTCDADGDTEDMQMNVAFDLRLMRPWSGFGKIEITRYYLFNRQRVALRRGSEGPVSYLYRDHLIGPLPLAEPVQIV